MIKLIDGYYFPTNEFNLMNLDNTITSLRLVNLKKVDLSNLPSSITTVILDCCELINLCFISPTIKYLLIDRCYSDDIFDIPTDIYECAVNTRYCYTRSKKYNFIEKGFFRGQEINFNTHKILDGEISTNFDNDLSIFY